MEAVERGIEESGILGNQGNLQESVKGLFSRLTKLPPDLKVLAITLIAGIILMVLEHAIYDNAKPNRPMTMNQRVKITQRITNTIFNDAGVFPQERWRFRIVIAEELPVFATSRRNSARIGQIAAPQIVIVKAKRRNWSKIEWRDSLTGETQIGWVFTRYLKKI